MADVDTISLTDLEVIQQFSLAVRGATAPRAAVIAALEADLAHLRGGTRRTAPAAASPKPASSRSAGSSGSSGKPAPARKAAAKKAPAKKASRSA